VIASPHPELGQRTGNKWTKKESPYIIGRAPEVRVVDREASEQTSNNLRRRVTRNWVPRGRIDSDSGGPGLGLRVRHRRSAREQGELRKQGGEQGDLHDSWH
jgi:hypothetical protein